MNEMRRQVHVGTRLFSLDNFDKRVLTDNGIGQWHTHSVSHEVPEVDLQVGNRLGRTQICLLARWLAWIAGSRAHARREILYLPDLVCGKDDGKQSSKIKPFLWGAATGTEVEVKLINVEIGNHAHPLKMQEPFLSERPRALSPMLPGVVLRSPLPPSFFIVKIAIHPLSPAELGNWRIGK